MELWLVVLGHMANTVCGNQSLDLQSCQHYVKWERDDSHMGGARSSQHMNMSTVEPHSPRNGTHNWLAQFLAHIRKCTQLQASGNIGLKRAEAVLTVKISEENSLSLKVGGKVSFRLQVYWTRVRYAFMRDSSGVGHMDKDRRSSALKKLELSFLGSRAFARTPGSMEMVQVSHQDSSPTCTGFLIWWIRDTFPFFTLVTLCKDLDSIMHAVN